MSGSNKVIRRSNEYVSADGEPPGSTERYNANGVTQITGIETSRNSVFFSKAGYSVTEEDEDKFKAWYRKWSGLLQVADCVGEEQTTEDMIDSSVTHPRVQPESTRNFSPIGIGLSTDFSGYLVDNCVFSRILDGSSISSSIFYETMYNAYVTAPLFYCESVKRQLDRHFSTHFYQSHTRFMLEENIDSFLSGIKLKELPALNVNDIKEAVVWFNEVAPRIKTGKIKNETKCIGLLEDSFIARGAIRNNCCLLTHDGDFEKFEQFGLTAILTEKA